MIPSPLSMAWDLIRAMFSKPTTWMQWVRFAGACLFALAIAYAVITVFLHII